MILEILYFITAPDRTDLYWRANRQGYTTDLADAGLYTEREAFNIQNSGRGDKYIPIMDKTKEIKDLYKQYTKYLENLTFMKEFLGIEDK